MSPGEGGRLEMIGAPPFPVRVSDRYVLERELGRGGMATVYLARDLPHGRLVAVKVVRPDVALELGTERFLREIRLAAQLHHPHILPLYDSGTLDGWPLESAGAPCPFYVMPFIDGETLGRRLAREGRLAPDEALNLAREVAGALDYAHRKNIVHRDIKPENILLEDGHAVVADFGVARAMTMAGEDDLTAAGLAVGTPAYMSPEQSVGETDLDGRTDVYSLACVLHEMLTGSPPFTGESIQSIFVHRLTERPEPLRTRLPEASEALEAVVARALARDRADRYPTAHDFAEALASVAPRAGSGPVTRISSPTVSESPSVAVLPFSNLSSDLENEYFSDGMTDEIIGALARVAGLRVAARTSSFAFKGKRVDAREIGERLKVTTLLEGSVRKAGDRVRVSAQLVSVADGCHLWSDTFERTLSDVFVLQDELARAIASALTRKFIGTPSSPLVRPATTNLEAYTLYLRGRHAVQQRTPDGFRRGIEAYREALIRDPGSALAQAGLAEAWALRGFGEFGDLAPEEAMPLAKAAAKEALRLDPLLAEGHTWLGVVHFLWDWDWPATERELRRSLELKPTMSVAHMWYGIALAALGRHGEALPHVLEAESLDPLWSTTGLTVGRALYWSRRYEESLARLRAVHALNPETSLPLVWCARACYAMGRAAEALELMDQAEQLESVPTVHQVRGMALARLGRTAEARAIDRGLAGASEGRPWVAAARAGLLIALGDTGEALSVLEESVNRRVSAATLWMGVDSEFDPVRGHPRFIALLRRMRLAD